MGEHGKGNACKDVCQSPPPSSYNPDLKALAILGSYSRVVLCIRDCNEQSSIIAIPKVFSFSLQGAEHVESNCMLKIAKHDFTDLPPSSFETH